MYFTWINLGSVSGLRKLAIENLPEKGRTTYQFAQVLQFAGIIRLRNPELQIASVGIFFPDMLKSTQPVSLPVKFRIMGEAVAYGTTDNCEGIDLTVRLRDNLAINAAWLGVARGPVILHRLSHNLYLLRREPAFQQLVRTQYPA